MNQTWLNTIATAKDVAEVAVVGTELAVAKAMEALTCDRAIALYRTVLRCLLVAIVFAALMVGKVAKWGWDNRHRTAIYHWARAAVESQKGRSMLTHGLIAEWVIRQWVEALTERRSTLVQKWRDHADLTLKRIGL
ncbi:MAG: hypothetical protein ACRC62_23510 [Microcoleus sp.]